MTTMKHLTLIFLIAALLASCATKPNNQATNNEEEKTPAAQEQMTPQPENEKQTEPKPEEALPLVAPVDTATLCDNPHSNECRKKVEAYLLEQYDLGQREGTTLVVKTAQGENVRLESNENPSPEKYISYIVGDYFPASGLLKVDVYYYEGGSNIIIDTQTGAQIKLDAMEGVSPSPNGQYFVASSLSLHTSYFPNQLTICQVKDDAIVKAKQKEFTPNEGPTNVRWLTNTSFQVDEVTLGPDMQYKVLNTHTFELTNGEWVQK